MVHVSYHVEDAITPSIKASSNSLPVRTKASLVVTATRAGADIARQYDRGQSRWTPLSPRWQAYKVRHGFNPQILHMRYLEGDSLETAVEWVRRMPGIVSYDPTLGTVNVDFSTLLEIFPYYTWYHEYGVRKAKGRVPKRDFIERGLMIALRRMERNYVRAQNRWAKDSERGVGPVSYSTEGRFRFPFHVSWILPPSKAYAAIGLVSDLSQAMQGSFFRPAALKAYIRAYAQASLATSTKVVRRRVRRGVHTGRA